jgi:hypothetical protein
MAGGAAFAAGIVIAVSVLSPAIRFWLGHLYLVRSQHLSNGPG